MITTLLTTDKVYEKNKSSTLRLLEGELYPGLVSLMVGARFSHTLAKPMLQQLLSVGKGGASCYKKPLRLDNLEMSLSTVVPLLVATLSRGHPP